MNQKSLHKELTAKADELRLVYANKVTVQRIAETEHYQVLTLEVNCGVEGSWSEQKTPRMLELVNDFKNAAPSLENGIISLKSQTSQYPYLTIDLNALIPSNWVVMVERLPCQATTFGVVFCHPDHLEDVSEVHALTNEDLRLAGEAQCDSLSGRGHFDNGGLQCERVAAHNGDHQAFSDERAHEWKTGSANTSPHGQFGFRALCPHCGFVASGEANGEKMCFDCNFWLEQLEHKGGFIIEGIHYRPGAGGFGGRQFNILKNDGSTWSGELFHQGDIPDSLRHLFPDNGVFV